MIYILETKAASYNLLRGLRLEVNALGKRESRFAENMNLLVMNPSVHLHANKAEDW